MRRVRVPPLAIALSLLGWLSGGGPSLAAPGAVAPAPAGAAKLVDRVVAVVDEDPILRSDIERVIGLGLVARAAGESDATLERRVLDGLIEERLRMHEIARYDFDQAPLDEADRQLETLRSRFATEEAWRIELARLGLDETRVRELLARQLVVLAFVEERLGPRVFVGLEDIQAYFEQELAPELRRRGETVPAIDEVRESIRAVLRERRLNEELTRWTKELRDKADVVDLLDARHDDLPPVVSTLGKPPAP